MMRSLFSGVSGLSNNQLKMDVIGNNIANINTIGFKTSRINFSEELSQLLRVAEQNSSGGTSNAILVGLGVRTGSIERDFSQGILQTTGKITDLGLEGEGFFVLNDGNQNLYTRAGNFHFDGNGRLVTANGASLQGWTAAQDGVISQTASVGDIVLDSTVISPAIATQNVAITGNLDASAAPLQEQWTASRSFTTGGSTPAVATTLLSALDQTTTPLVAGDTITIDGTNSDGTAITPTTYTYAVGDSIQDLIDDINTAFTASGTIALDTSGRLVLTDTAYGESSTTLTLTAGAGNTGVITLPGFINTQEGFEPQTSSSIEVFDSLGIKHTLNVIFTKTENAREWNFAMSTTGDETISEGSTGTITFANDGSLETIFYTGGESQLKFDPGNGAGEVSLNLDFENQTGFSGITQFAGTSSVLLPFQDGQAQGALTSFSVQSNGEIRGAFDNGRSRLIGRLAIADINNPEGLLHIGNNIYSTSSTSGLAVLAKAGETIATTVIPGTLEASNVDLAAEFTEMIIAQRAFQANARVITVSDQFLAEVTQLKR